MPWYPTQEQLQRSADTIRRYHRRTGMTYSGHYIWTDEELATLRRLWPDRRAIVAALDRRSLHAVDAKAAKLGLRQPGHQWTTSEAAAFRRLWPHASQAELLEAFPWANWSVLSNYAQWQRAHGYPNLARPRTALRPVGDPLVDGILALARKHNYSLCDLDEAANSRRYFQSGRYRWRRSYRYLARAVKHFGGELVGVYPGDDD